MSMLAMNASTATGVPVEDCEAESFQIYHISYLWYTLVGSSICIIVSLIASFIIGANKPSELNPNLLAPFVRKLIRPRSSETASNKTENVIEKSLQLRRTDVTDDSFWSSFHALFIKCKNYSLKNTFAFRMSLLLGKSEENGEQNATNSKNNVIITEN